MSPLQSYLDRNKVSKLAFAASVGASRSHISEIASGIKAPSWDLAVRIEKETGGAVKVTAWPKFARVAQHVHDLRRGEAASTSQAPRSVSRRKARAS